VTTFFLVVLLRGNHPPVPTCQNTGFLRPAAHEGVLHVFNRSELSLCIGSLLVLTPILISFNAGQSL